MNIKSEKEEIDNIRNEVHELQEQSDLYRILTLEDSFEQNRAPLVTGRVGGSQPHNNLQPYQVVAYWKRIA